MGDSAVPIAMLCGPVSVPVTITQLGSTIREASVCSELLTGDVMRGSVCIPFAGFWWAVSSTLYAYRSYIIDPE